jgi:transcription antitermination protein NusB
MMLTDGQPVSSARGAGRPNVHGPEREGRQVALAAIFEAEFGQRTATSALARRLSSGEIGDRAGKHARRIVDAVVRYRDSIDARIEEVAPAYPVVQLAKIDRALLRCGMGELLHCPTTPARVAISEWVELARTYSGEPTRRLMNGVLGNVASSGDEREGTEQDGESLEGREDTSDIVDTAQTEGPTE